MKKKLIALIMVIVMGMGTAVMFTACSGAGEDPFLDSLLERIEQLEQEAGNRDAILAEVEVMLLERDLAAALNALDAINAQIRIFDYQMLTPAVTAFINADAAFMARAEYLGLPLGASNADINARNNSTDNQMIALRHYREAALQTRNLVQAQLDTALTERAAILVEVDRLHLALNGAGHVAYATMLVGHLSRRIVRDGNYVIVPNRHYAIHASQWPTIAPPHAVRPARAIRVPVNPQRVAVMCSSFLDIMIALGVQDRVVAFTHMAQPDFIEEHFPRTGANALPDLTSRTAPIEPHSPDFPTLLNVNPDLILMSSRARARPRNYFGRLSHIAPTIDIGSRTGVDTFIQDVVENVLILGAIFDVQEVAFDQIVALISRMREVNDLATSLQANALIVQFTGMTAMALFGAASRYSFVHRELGITQAAPPHGASQAIANATYQHGTPAGAELLRYVNPDIIFVVDRYALNEHRDAPTPINILNHDLFRGMYAIENGHVHQLDPVNWYLVLCGFRSLMYQFDEIYTALRALQTARAS